MRSHCSPQDEYREPIVWRRSGIHSVEAEEARNNSQRTAWSDMIPGSWGGEEDPRKLTPEVCWESERIHPDFGWSPSQITTVSELFRADLTSACQTDL